MKYQNADHDRRIVVGVDGSQHSRTGLGWAITPARLAGATVEAVSAWPDPATIGYSYGVPTALRPVWTRHRTGDVPVRLPGRWRWLSVAAAGLAAVGSIAGFLAWDRVYGGETAVLADAAAAQDAVNLVLVVPLLLGLGIAASRGSMAAHLAWLGCLAFTVYNYAIYAFAVHFGPLFLLWIAVLGLSTFALIGGLAALNVAAVESRYAGRGLPVTAWLLIIAAALFAGLWLSEMMLLVILRSVVGDCAEELV